MSNLKLLSKLSILPPNKTLVFYSPIEGNDVLVRTGVVSGENCVFHALLHGHTKEYAQADKKRRNYLVKKLVKSISSDLQTEATLTDKEASYLQKEFLRFIVKFYKFRKPGKSEKYKAILKNEKDVETYKAISELLTIDKIKETLSSCEPENYTLKHFREFLINTFTEMVNTIFSGIKPEDTEMVKKKVAFLEKVLTLVRLGADNADRKILHKKRKNFTPEFTPQTLSLLCNKLNCSIYVLESKNRIPVNLQPLVAKNNAIILLWHGGLHYEVVARLLPDNKLQRLFESSDPIIQKIESFLYRPSEFRKNYPNLAPYLPKENRESSSESESESGSDSGSDSGSESGSNSDSESGSNSGSDSQSGSESGTNSRFKSKSHSGSRSKSKKPKKRRNL